MIDNSGDTTERLLPYVPRLLVHWLHSQADLRGRELDGTLVFVDVSGFTAMSERLARHGKVGAEEVTDVIGGVFTRLLAVAYGYGGGLLKFGGDALLLFFSGPGHEARGARSAAGMRQALREIGRLQTSAGAVTLRMSVGVHGGRFLFALVGDSHRELVVAGPSVTRTVAMERLAGAGEIVVSSEVAAGLPSACLGAVRDGGVLLRRVPPGLDAHAPDERSAPGVDLLPCIPAGLRDHLLAAMDDPEHRPVTVAFVRFSDVDRLLASEGLEVVVAALDRLVAAVQEAADAYGVTFLGTDIDRDGGKIILVGGAPRALDSDDDRVLHTVHGVVNRQLDLPVRAGVSRGHVFAGDVGPPYRRTYTVMGDAVNLAARLAARAEPGQVLAATAVLDASATEFTSEPVAPFTVKGKKEPVAAAVVGTALGAGRPALWELPLVGREEEMATIAAAVDELRKGRGGIVEIVGPPGIGKSRLLAELTRRAEGARLLTAGCEPYASSTPYRPFALLLREALGIPAGAAGRELTRLVRSRVRATAPALIPWLPLVAIPLDLELPPTPEVADLGQEFRRERLEEVVTELLARLLPAPAVLAIEDVHWLDEASSSLLDRVVKELEGRPWLLCVTRRDEPTGFSVSADRAVRSVRPQPLSDAEVGALAIAASEEAPLRPDEIAAIIPRSDGNPLFVQELVRGVRSAGGPDSLPETLEAMTMAEIDRLAAGDRRVLRRASVLGMSFEDELLAQLFPPEEAPEAGTWRRLADFVVEDGPGRRRFRHALVRDAAYETLAFRRRRELHAHAADVIEATVDDPDDHAELLSLHYLRAGNHERAWQYARSAGEQAVAKFANAEAASLFRRALEAARGARGAISPSEVGAIFDALGEVAEKIGAYEEATRAYREASRRLGTEPVQAARLLSKRAIVAEKTGRYGSALRYLRRGLSLLEGLPGREPAAARAELATRYAGGKFRQGRHAEAERWCRAAIAEAELSGDRAGLAWAYLMLDAVNMELGTVGDRPYGRMALPILEEVGELQGLARQLVNLGARAYYEGDWREAATLYTRGLALFVRIGDSAGEAQTQFNLGELVGLQGRLEEAGAHLRGALRFWRAAGDSVGAALALAELGRLAARLGNPEQAFPMLEEARAQLVAAGAEADLLEADAHTCECFLAAREAEKAIALADELLERVRRGGEVASVREYRLRRLRGEGLAATGRFAEARKELEAGLDGARSAHARYEQAQALGALAALADTLGEASAELAEERHAILDWLDVV